MKNTFAWLSVLALIFVAIVTIASLFTSAATRYDFHLRLAEVDCVKRAVDPFRVWNEEVVVKPYYSNNPEIKSIPPGCNEQISVYPPWEYTLMLPLSFLGKSCAWWTYSSIEVLLILCAVILAFSTLRHWNVVKPEATIAAFTPIIAVAYPIWSNFQVGNHIIIVLFAALLMAHCLNNGKDIAAGLCWMLVMLKPQIGLIFAIPIAMRMKLATGITAVATCLILSIYPVVQCNASLIDLLKEPSEASSFAFLGCGTWPKMLCGTFSTNGDIVAGMAIGAIACLAMTWLIRKEKDWFVFLMPAAITSCSWTYANSYCHAMGWFVAFVIVRELLHNPKSKIMWAFAAIGAFSLTRWFLAWHGLSGVMGWRFPMSEYAFRCLDSLNSTLSLALGYALCVRVADSGRFLSTTSVSKRAVRGNMSNQRTSSTS